MKKSKVFKSISVQLGMLALVGIFVLSGCATKKYVGEYVGEQVKPVSDRISQAETRIGQAEGQIAKMGERATTDEAKITKLEGDINKVDAKAEQALASFGKLKFERKLVIDMKDGATFEFNSAKLPDDAKQAIDAFLGNVKGENTVFLVAGHTDNSGSEDTNYELGKRRAENVARYLVTQKKIDPVRLVTVSYGETSPIADNDTREGRAKNRRVEIFAYTEGITK
jgi:peptidoglycan-associated lipoprotein